MNQKWTTSIWLFITGSLFFFPLLGSVHLFDWDEINFAESAREMLITKSYFRVQIDFQPFTEKPPLFFWVQALSMHIFGINEWAARFPNALLGCIVLVILYVTGRKIKDHWMGVFWSLSFLGSLLPHLYFRSGIIDPLFNIFMFLAIVQLWTSVNAQNRSKKTTYAGLGGLFTGLAVLTKGPVGFLLVFLSFVTYWMMKKFKPVTNIKDILIYALTTFLITTVWYGYETYQYGWTFIEEFTKRQIEIFTTSDAGHGQPIYYHFIVLLLGCFPSSLLAINSLYYNRKGNNNDFYTWMLSVLIIVLLVFSASTTKILHYSSFAYYPITFFAAWYMHNLISDEKRRFGNWWIAGIVFSSVLGLLFMVIGIFPLLKSKVVPFINDEFAVANLSADVSWSGLEWLSGIVLLMGSILGWKLLKENKIKSSAFVLFGSVAVSMFLFTTLIIPRIEQYTQGANIKFFKNLQGKNVYVGTAGYKSYAHLFYAGKQPQTMSAKPIEQLAKESWAIPIYLSVKNIQRSRMDTLPEFKLIGEENGFLFYLKPVQTK